MCTLIKMKRMLVGIEKVRVLYDPDGAGIRTQKIRGVSYTTVLSQVATQENDP